MNKATKKYPGPGSVAKRVAPLANWLRANKPTCKTITATRDDMVGLRKARPAVLQRAGFHMVDNIVRYAEFTIADPPALKPIEQKQESL